LVDSILSVVEAERQGLVAEPGELTLNHGKPKCRPGQLHPVDIR